MTELGNEARRFVRGQHNGVLCTISQRIAGYPFGSVAPFILDAQGRPVVLISTLAEHTRNIVADPRVSLIVQPFTPDMQGAGRVTLVGRAERLESKDALGPRYLRYFPQAEAYLAMHDFAFYRIGPERIRYIGGFGKIHWIEAAAYLAGANHLAEAEAGILDHMNREHSDALFEYCRHFHGATPEAVEMIGIDGDGFDCRADGRVLRFDFPQAIVDAGGARQALVEMVQQCRI
ncbi:hypothetical protein EDC61_101272 [Sulfuritortus calidifontis]|uniref:Uncharacterized protein n=1 Tax=Sulfuritortus calidifontis TaxID=1914471 RepID=A0A4R3JZ26_9PROT|nr:DUF2470 domain-containing protein [Sulfuritortus calidifontis]TCS74048.1 hypothetical protein EDC61_101272 [Sulfuritortus calidifontis]